jgi:hypothetical protein
MPLVTFQSGIFLRGKLERVKGIEPQNPPENEGFTPDSWLCGMLVVKNLHVSTKGA